MSVEALGDVWRPEDVPDVRLRWVHIAPLSRVEWPVETIASLARRCRVSFDGQGLTRVPELGPLRLDDDFDRDILRHLWVLKLAEEEAEVLGDPRRSGRARGARHARLARLDHLLRRDERVRPRAPDRPRSDRRR